jgi:hypothetical protein
MDTQRDSYNATTDARTREIDRTMHAIEREIVKLNRDQYIQLRRELEDLIDRAPRRRDPW